MRFWTNSENWPFLSSTKPSARFTLQGDSSPMGYFVAVNLEKQLKSIRRSTSLANSHQNTTKILPWLGFALKGREKKHRDLRFFITGNLKFCPFWPRGNSTTSSITKLGLEALREVSVKIV